jgi:hydrogenase maturation protease
LSRLVTKLGLPTGSEFDIDITFNNIRILFCLQLTPELCDDLVDFSRVCFIDAHTGTIEGDFKISILNHIFEVSPFSHHLTPQTLLELCHKLYNHIPEAIQISARGYQFGFKRSLSKKTMSNVEIAVNFLVEWINGKDKGINQVL